MKAVIDRFEGEFAVCETEDGKMINVGKARLPRNVHEGDVLSITDTGISVDKSATERKKHDVENMCRNLWN